MGSTSSHKTAKKKLTVSHLIAKILTIGRKGHHPLSKYSIDFNIFKNSRALES